VILVAETRGAVDRIVEQVQVIDFFMQHISRATAEQAFSLGVSTRLSTIWIRRGSKTRWASQCQRADTVTIVSRHHESLRSAERFRSGRAKNSKMMLTCKWLIQRSMCEPHASLRVIRPPATKTKSSPIPAICVRAHQHKPKGAFPYRSQSQTRHRVVPGSDDLLLHDINYVHRRHDVCKPRTYRLRRPTMRLGVVS